MNYDGVIYCLVSSHFEAISILNEWINEKYVIDLATQSTKHQIHEIILY